MVVYVTPFSNCDKNNSISKSGSACIALCTRRLRSYSPMDSHAFSMGFITNDYQTDINKVCSRPKELLKSCESSLSSWLIQQSADDNSTPNM